MMKKISGNILTVLFAGLAVGVLDGMAAIILARIKNGSDPVKVFQYVASGVLGQDAFTGGMLSFIIGISCHFLIAFIWTILFFSLYRPLKVADKDFILVGMIYGMIVLLTMQIVVLPLSGVPSSNPEHYTIWQILIHMFLVGLPISAAARFFLIK